MFNETFYDKIPNYSKLSANDRNDIESLCQKFWNIVSTESFTQGDESRKVELIGKINTIMQARWNAKPFDYKPKPIIDESDSDIVKVKKRIQTLEAEKETNVVLKRIHELSIELFEMDKDAIQYDINHGHITPEQGEIKLQRRYKRYFD